MSNTRQATLVVVSSSGELRGEVGPLSLAVPWWQESGPIGDLIPGAIVLRLLAADPTRTEEMGGPVAYLIELDGPLPAPLALRSGSAYGDLDVDHPLRHPWARVGGPTEDLAWAASQVAFDPERRPRQERTWNLSTIWSIPFVGNGTSTTAWLKCVPPFFAHEPAVLQIMSDQAIPTLLARDQHRMLLAGMPGYDGYRPTADDERAMVDALVSIQLASANKIEPLLAAGVPDLRTPRLIEELRALVDRLAPQDSVLNGFIASLPDRMVEVDAMGLPDVLGHGDPHGGNCRLGITPPLWFDWGDSFIGNPLLDVAALHRMSDTTVQHWLDRWAATVAGSTPHQSWTLLKPVALLRMAWVYQRFCDNIEPNERIYHQTDVMDSLDNTRQTLAAT